ncbi:MAG: HAMP domain-containing protein, partial [Endomicrobiales bacterium]
MTLRTKFILYISSLILLIILGISESIFLTQKTLLLGQLEENRSKIFKDFRYTCNEALVVKDEIQVFNTIKSIIKTHYPAIVYAGYLSPSGTVLFSARDPDQEKKLRDRITKVGGFKESELELAMHGEEKETVHEFAFPFYLQDEYRGTIKAGFSRRYLEDQVREGMQVIKREILKVAVISLILGIVLANILAFYIVKPIQALARAADDIGSGNLDIRVNINRRDEIGKLGKTFNQMARKLKELDELKDGF